MKETDIFLGFWISQIRLVNDRIFEKLLLSNDLEISRGQWNIIFVLWGEDHLTISEISERTLLAKNTVSIIVNDMVKKGIVQRNINPENRRESIVSLTEHVR